MINVRKDMSYVSELDLKAIENGLADLSVHSLRITNFYTEEQKKENLNISHTLTREQWSAFCEENRKAIATKVEPIIDIISQSFMIYQYKDKSVDYRKDDWDLFFWCNCGDMSYVTLSSNDKRTTDKQMDTVNAVLDLIKSIDMDGIEVIIQYTAIYNESLVGAVILEYCEKMQDKMIDFGGHTGKIIKYGDTFYFKKKHSKKQLYDINSNAVLRNVFAM